MAVSTAALFNTFLQPSFCLFKILLCILARVDVYIVQQSLYHNRARSQQTLSQMHRTLDAAQAGCVSATNCHTRTRVLSKAASTAALFNSFLWAACSLPLDHDVLQQSIFPNRARALHRPRTRCREPLILHKLGASALPPPRGGTIVTHKLACSPRLPFVAAGDLKSQVWHCTAQR